MKITRHAPRPRPHVEAVQFDASLGWDHALELAAWCGGEAVRDEHEGQREKTYYWYILLDAEYLGFRAVTGDYVCLAPDGTFFRMRADEFYNVYATYAEKENA